MQTFQSPSTPSIPTRLKHFRKVTRSNASLPPRPGFTLIELLVVIAIIGVLMGILLPAVQSVREAARRIQCSNNIRQVTIATMHYESARKSFPPSMIPPPPGQMFPTTNGSWGILGRILSFIEQENAASLINLEVGYDQPPNSTSGVTFTRIPSFMCASEINDTLRLEPDGSPSSYPANYVGNFGTWFVWDPVSRRGGDGMFFPGSNIRTRDVTDGLSHTLLFSEVRTFTPYARNMTSGVSPSPPSSIAEVANYVIAAPDKKMGTSTNDNKGHTEWPDGATHHAGFTTALTPNSNVKVTIGGVVYKHCDFNSQREGRHVTNPTYAAITARSYHAGGIINVAMADGSIRNVTSQIELAVWRSLGSRQGGEVVTLAD